MKRLLAFRSLCALCGKRGELKVINKSSSLLSPAFKLHQRSLSIRPVVRHNLSHAKKFSTLSHLQQIFVQEEEFPILEETENVFHDPTGKYKAAAPIDDVYIIDHYPPKEYSLEEALKELRKMDSWAYNGGLESRIVSLHMEVDNALKKKKRVEDGNRVVIPPHPFGSQVNFVVFAEGDDATLAEEMGAPLVLGLSSLQEINDEELDLSSYDAVLCKNDLLPSLAPIKRKIRTVFPSLKRGTAAKNLPLLINKYKHGSYYTVTKEPELYVDVGNLSLTDDQLEENIAFYLEHVASLKDPKYGPYVLQVQLTASFLDSILIDASDYLPEFDEEED